MSKVFFLFVGVLVSAQAGLWQGKPVSSSPTRVASQPDSEKTARYPNLSKGNLVQRCQKTTKTLEAYLKRQGLDPRTHPLFIQAQKLLEQLSDASDVDSLFLLEAGQCEGIDNAVASIKMAEESMGVGTRSLNPPLRKRPKRKKEPFEDDNSRPGEIPQASMLIQKPNAIEKLER